jgi:hypothetical protein
MKAVTAREPTLPAQLERRSASGRPPALLSSDLPTTEALLVSGGDARIAFTAERQANRYGCRALPDPQLVALGSSTASVISEAGFAAADRLRQRILMAAQSESWSDVYATELQRVRRELSELCGVAELPGVEVVFAASGTDLHLVAAQLTGSNDAASTLAISADASETGSSVPAALAGRHFSTRAAFCERLNEGALLRSDRGIDVASIALRSDDARPRPTSLVDDEIVALVDRAAVAGRRVLLIVVDVSKTGLLAPSLACVAALRRRFPDQLDVLIDACQFRIAPATLRAYLEHGCMIAITGSKFVTGPAFSGALFIPRAMSLRLRARPLPSGLRDYCSRADWPQAWAAGQGLPCVDNFGLLLRWEAALQELRALRAVPDSQIAQFLESFAAAIRERLRRDDAFEPLEVPALERSGLLDLPSWDRTQTIFPFLLRRAAPGIGHSYLDREQTTRIYRQLQEAQVAPEPDVQTAAMRCQLGQPVACGRRAGVAVSALRLCASARMVVEATRDSSAGSRLIARALRALDKAAWLVRSGL